MQSVDWTVIALFLLSVLGAVGVVPLGRFAPAVVIAATLVVGIRALFLLEFGTMPMVGVQGVLFLVGLLAVGLSVQRLQR